MILKKNFRHFILTIFIALVPYLFFIAFIRLVTAIIILVAEVFVNGSLINKHNEV